MSMIEITKNNKSGQTLTVSKYGEDFYQMSFLLDGEGVFYIDDTSYPVRRGSVVILPPSTRYVGTGKNLNKVSIVIFEEILTDFEKFVLKSFIKTPVTTLSNKSTGRIFDTLKTMGNLSKTSKFREDVLHILLSFILLELFEQNSNSKNSDSKQVPPMIFNILNYIEKNYQKKITLEMISKEFNYSAISIRKNFKKHMGESISDYILNFRLDKVKAMLSTTNKSMNEIAEKCGFSSANYMSLIFKEKESMSPFAYRKIKH